jgi:hypothetical protein
MDFKNVYNSFIRKVLLNMFTEIGVRKKLQLGI